MTGKRLVATRPIALNTRLAEPLRSKKFPLIARCYPTSLGFEGLGFRSWLWRGFAVLEDPVSERTLTKPLGEEFAVLLGRRGRRRLYAWAGHEVPRPLLRSSLIAAVEPSDENLLIRGNRALAKTFGLTCTHLAGFSVRKGRGAKKLADHPIVLDLAAADCRILHGGTKTWGMRFEGDVAPMTRVSVLLKRLADHLEEAEVDHHAVWWEPTGWQFSGHGGQDGSPWLGPSAYVNVRIPGDTGDSYVGAEGFSPDGDDEDGVLARFDELVGEKF